MPGIQSEHSATFACGLQDRRENGRPIFKVAGAMPKLDCAQCDREPLRAAFEAAVSQLNNLLGCRAEFRVVRGFMRLALLAGLLSVVVGCSGNRPSGAKPSGVQQSITTPRTAVRTNASGMIVTPANNSATGRVALLNAQGGFVILTYPVGQLPPLGKRLSVYHNGMKVGELKVTEPQRDQNTAADIMAGEAHVGDEARGD